MDPMNKKPFFLYLLVLFLSGIALVQPGTACRFNVRDVGFVEFGTVPYRMYGTAGEGVDASLSDAFQQIAFAALLDSNVEWEWVDFRQSPLPQAQHYFSKSNTDNMIQAVLVPENGAPLPLSIPVEKAGNIEDEKNKLWTLLDGIVTSPMREAIIQQSIESYCVLLLVEGTEEKNNRQAEEVVKQVIQRIEQNLDQLPKEIKNPPTLQVLSRSQFEEERVLLWSLGIDPLDSRPHAAVIYGRGRQIGEVLSGDEISLEALYRIASMIGLSCECGLDHSWMMGTLIPFRWTNEWKTQMAAQLTFDPEDPMIKTEISQILSNSFLGRGIQSNPDLLAGYGEITLGQETVISEESTGIDREKSAAPGTIESGVVEFTSGAISPRTVLIWSFAGLVMLGIAGGMIIVSRAKGN